MIGTRPRSRYCAHNRGRPTRSADNGAVTPPPPTARPLAGLVVAVLDYNGGEMTRRCARSLTPLRDRGATVLVVDNASVSPVADAIAAELGARFAALRLSENRGVAGGYSAALEWGARRGASHVLLLNNDTTVAEPTFADELLAASVMKVAVVAPRILDETGAVVSAGAWLDWRRCRTHHIRTPLAEEPYAAEWVHGAAMLISVAAYRDIGGFDETFFMYWEDVDLCLRAWQLGYRCLVAPAASILHVGGATMGRTRTARFILRNSLLLMRKHGSAEDHMIFIVYFIVRRLPLYVLRNVWPPSRLHEALSAAYNAIAWNVRHARALGRWRLDGLRDRPIVR